MKIGTRIAAGFAALIVLMLAAQLYQLWLLARVQSSGERLASVSVEAVQQSLNLKGSVRQLGEFVEKSFVSPEYRRELTRLREQLSNDLQLLRQLALSREEEIQVDTLESSWQMFCRLLEPLEQHPIADLPGKSAKEHLHDLMLQLQVVDAQLEHVIEQSREAIHTQIQQSRLHGQRAHWISRIAVAVAVALSVLAGFLLIRSISLPLRELKEATRAMSRGSFEVAVRPGGQDEIGELTRNFNRMAQRLGELDQLKKDFVSHVSHELKAPLASMQETTRLIAEEIPGPLNDQQKRLLNLNLRSGQRLSGLIRAVLDLSALEARAMRYSVKDCNVCLIAERACEEFQAFVREKQLRLEFEGPSDPVWVRGDETRLHQIVTNLLSNAIRFSPEKGTVSVRVDTSGLGEKKMCRLKIADRGPGVPDQQKRKIFEKFHELDGSDRPANPGTGLGLAIARGIVLDHKGEIWVEDRPGGGSLFMVTLPSQNRAPDTSADQL